MNDVGVRPFKNLANVDLEGWAETVHRVSLFTVNSANVDYALG